MICERCEDQGTIPAPGNETLAYRCPDCKGMSFTRALEDKYAREERRAKIIAYVCMAIVGIAIGVQFA